MPRIENAGYPAHADGNGAEPQRLECAPPHWEHFVRNADIGLRGYGHSLDETFAQAALAMMAMIVEPDRVEAQGAVTLECRAPDLNLLLSEWLHVLRTEIAVRNRVFCAFDVHITGRHLHAIAWGEPLAVARHSPAADLEAAVFSAARVVLEGSDTWLAECVVEF